MFPAEVMFQWDSSRMDQLGCCCSFPPVETDCESCESCETLGYVDIQTAIQTVIAKTLWSWGEPGNRISAPPGTESGRYRRPKSTGVRDLMLVEVTWKPNLPRPIPRMTRGKVSMIAITQDPKNAFVVGTLWFSSTLGRQSVFS